MTTGRKKYQADINITPYIDILLVLLIIFMMVAPMKQYEHPVRVPQPAKKIQPKEVKPDSIIVDMAMDHSIKLNQQPITLTSLESTLKEIFRRRAAKSMFIRGESDLQYGDVFVLLDIAHRSGAVDIALLTKTSAPSSPDLSKSAP